MNARNRFDKVVVPRAPAALRENILRAAAAAPAPPEVRWIDRVWENRMIRRAWFAACLALFLFLVFWNPRLPVEAPRQQPVTGIDNQEEARIVSGLPRRPEIKNAESAAALKGETL